MNFFSRKKKNRFFSEEESVHIVQAIRQAELQTSGEVRVFVESRCRYVDAIDRATELFFGLDMQKTEQRNGVLVYVAMKDRQLAVFGDQGIHEKVGAIYWKAKVQKMIGSFNRNDYAEGLKNCVLEIGKALHQHFPYDRQIDKNELPDDIVFGR